MTNADRCAAVLQGKIILHPIAMNGLLIFHDASDNVLCILCRRSLSSLTDFEDWVGLGGTETVDQVRKWYNGEWNGYKNNYILCMPL
jgi:hypothetical protein